MTKDRLVHCRKFDKLLPGLSSTPIPGPVGEDVYENVSAQAWREWQSLQTMLINEGHLSMRDPDARKWLAEQRDKFLRDEDYEQPAGYIPPDS